MHFLCAIERLSETQRAGLFRKLCRDCPRLQHARLAHDPQAVNSLRGLLARPAAGVLAAIVVAIANGPGAELRALLRYLGVVHRHDDGWHTNLAANGMDCLILVANRQSDPLLPRFGSEERRGARGERRILRILRSRVINFQAGGDVGGHYAERLLRRAHVDSLPVAVKDPPSLRSYGGASQHGCFRQYVDHIKVTSDEWREPEAPTMVRGYGEAGQHTRFGQYVHKMHMAAASGGEVFDLC